MEPKLAAPNRKLLDSAKRMKEQVASVDRSSKYSEEYKAKFRAKQAQDFAAMQRIERDKTVRLADEMKAAAKEQYLLGAIDSFAQKELELFRDYVGAAPTTDIVDLAQHRAKGLGPEKVLVLGGELRRRGETVAADMLGDLVDLTAEPWKSTPQWNKAEDLVLGFETLDVYASTMAQFGQPAEPYMLNEDGPVAIGTFFG